MTDDNKPTIENPLKTGLRQRAGLGLSKKKAQVARLASRSRWRQAFSTGVVYFFRFH